MVGEKREEKIIVIDFGGQYNQLIARRVRECNVYSEVYPNTISLDEIKEMAPKGIIFTGGPGSVYLKDSPTISADIFNMGIPILGICYGAQLIAHLLGGKVSTAPTSEYGRTVVGVDRNSVLMSDVGSILSGKTEEKCSENNSPDCCEEEKEYNYFTTTWMSHTDYISDVPEGFAVTAKTPVCPVAAMENSDRKIYATQFHPEVKHSVEGQKIISHFVYDVCGIIVHAETSFCFV